MEVSPPANGTKRVPPECQQVAEQVEGVDQMVITEAALELVKTVVSVEDVVEKAKDRESDVVIAMETDTDTNKRKQLVDGMFLFLG